MEEVGFVSYTAGSHQGAIRVCQCHFCVILVITPSTCTSCWQITLLSSCPACVYSALHSNTSPPSHLFCSHVYKCIVFTDVCRKWIKPRPCSRQADRGPRGQSGGGPLEPRLTCANCHLWKTEAGGHVSLFPQTAWSEARSGRPLFE